MKNQEIQPTSKASRSKVIAVAALYSLTVIIILLGLSFSIYSIANNVSLSVLNSKVPGAVFGAVIIFLGVRYYLSVGRLKDEIFKTSSTFSWSNFTKGRKKAISKSR